MHNSAKRENVLPFEPPIKQETPLQTLAENTSYDWHKGKAIAEITQLLKKAPVEYCIELAKRIKERRHDQWIK